MDFPKDFKEEIKSPDDNQGQQSDHTETAARRPHKVIEQHLDSPNLENQNNKREIIRLKALPVMRQRDFQPINHKKPQSWRPKGKKQFLDLTRMSDLKPFCKKLTNIQTQRKLYYQIDENSQA